MLWSKKRRLLKQLNMLLEHLCNHSKKVMNHGKEYPWIFGQFDHAPIVAASAVMTSLRSDVLQVQNLASTHIKMIE